MQSQHLDRGAKRAKNIGQLGLLSETYENIKIILIRRRMKRRRRRRKMRKEGKGEEKNPLTPHPQKQNNFS